MLGLMLTRTHRRLLADEKRWYDGRVRNLLSSQEREVDVIVQYYKIRLAEKSSKKS